MLRSQLLVLLQSRAVCDAQGHPLQPSAQEPEHAEVHGQRRASLDARMRAFFTRPRFRYRWGPACQQQHNGGMGRRGGLITASCTCGAGVDSNACA